MKIEKKICDNCKAEEDLLVMKFGGRDTWQILYLDTESERRKRVDLCCNKCIINYLVDFHKEG